jgi:hypothetical protein
VLCRATSAAALDLAAADVCDLSICGDLVQEFVGAEVHRSAAEGGGGQSSSREFIGPEDFEFLAHRQPGRQACFVEHQDPSIHMDGRGRIVAPKSFGPVRLASLRIDAGSDSVVRHEEQFLPHEHGGGSTGGTALETPGDV